MGMYDGLDTVQGQPLAPPPTPPSVKDPSLYDGLDVLADTAARPASGMLESIRAGFQGSAPGLAWRGKLPDLVMDPEHSKWWERAAAGITQVGAELPIMAVGGAVGLPAGTAVGGPVGGILGTGAGMFAVPAAIRESLIQAYKSGEINTAADWFNIVREVAQTTLKEGAIGAATFGAGALAKTGLAAAMGANAAERAAIGFGTATMATRGAQRAVAATDTAAQIATMVTMPAALQGRLPDAQEFLDAAIVIGGLKAAHPIAARMTNIYRRTGKTPAEQVADAQADPKVADELKNGPERPETEVPPLAGQLSKQEELWTIQDRKAAEAKDNPLAALDDTTLRLVGELGPGGEITRGMGIPEADWKLMEDRGLVKEGTTEQGDKYSYVEADALAKERERRFEAEKAARAERKTDPEEVARAIERRADNYDRAAKDKEEAGYPEEGAPLREKAKELRARADTVRAESAEKQALSAKIASIEAEIGSVSRGTSREQEPPTARFSTEQLAEAEKTARTRLEALTEKAAQGPLTDAERAERIGLTNAIANPEALAKRFGIEPAIRIPTAEERDASAKRVYDDVLRQLTEADQARQASGLQTLGDVHNRGVASILSDEARSYGEMLGRMPEDVFQERYMRVRENTAKAVQEAQTEAKTELAEQVAATPADLPYFVPPEVDLFGNPVEPNYAPRHSVEGKPIENVPVVGLTLSKDVPQFKHDANAQGVVEPLGGEPDPTGWAIQVWQRLNGALEVISGRHRLELWRRHGLETIPTQIHKESEGFTARDASMLDAELNIRDQQGSVADYVQYFKDRGYTREQADKLGLLARSKGQMAFAIARDGTPTLIAANRAYRSGSDTGLSPEAAFAISQAAPGSERLQNVGIAMVNEGKSTLFAVNMMKSFDMMAAERMAAGDQGDIFGFDDSAMREAAAMAKKASSAQRKISEQISAVSGASRRPELARKMGVDVQDPEGIQKKIAELKQEQYQWDNWPLYPELVMKLRAADTLKQEPLPDQEFPRAAEMVDGRTVRESIPNMGSISASLLDYTVLPGVREVRLDAFDPQYKPATSDRVRALAEQIKESGELNPLIVVKDKDGLYILEGGTRFDALLTMGAKSFPAKVVLDNESLAEWRAQEPFELKPETPAELKARDAEAAAAAKRKLAQERAGVKGPVPTVDQADLFNTQRTLFQTEEKKPWYYSELARSIESSPMKQGTAKAWQDYIKSRVGKGVKNEEIEATGINDWLAAQEGRVTKEQVQAFMEQGGVKVTETTYGDLTQESQERLDDARMYEDLAHNDFSQAVDEAVGFMERGGANQVQLANAAAAFRMDRPGDGSTTLEPAYNLLRKYAPEGYDFNKINDYFDAWQAERNRLDHIQAGTERSGRFSGYQLPGSVPGSYRELVLTLPEKAEPTNTAQALDPMIRQLSRWPQQPHIARELGDQARLDELNAEWDRRERAGQTRKETTFESSHFPGSDYLAHTRVNDRILPDGRKVLFVEEIQSDRAQKGRQEGFITPAIKAAKATYNRGLAVWHVFDAAGNELGSMTGMREHPTEQDAVNAFNARGGQDQQLGFAGGKVPTAPFVTKTDSWTALVLKRLLRYAAEGGYDAISWTRGEQQVERYTSALRKAVDVIEWKKTPEGVQIVGYKGKPYVTDEGVDQAIRQRGLDALRRNDFLGFDTNGEAIQAVRENRADWPTRWDVPDPQDRISINAFADAIKNERRTKVVDTTEKESALSDAIGKSMADKIRNDPNQTGTIEGENITVSDTGMSEYYDQIVPKVVADVAKKIGGGKVVELPIPMPTKGPEENYYFTQGGRRYPGEFVINDQNGVTVETGFLSKSEAEARVNELNDERVKPSQQQAIEITPAMREKIMAGLPLFQNKPQEAAGKHLASYDVAERLVTLFEGANKSSVIHEVGHHFLENLKYYASQPDAPQRIKDMWATARQEFAIGEDGNISTASHEMNARSFERYLGEGVAPSVGLRAVFAQFKAWMLEIYGNLQNLGVKINPEIKSLFDRMLATDQEIADAREMDVPRAYVPEARAAAAERIVPPAPEGRKIEPGFAAEQASMQPYADELPPGPGMAPDTSHVNYAYINSPQDVKLAMQRMAEIDQANIQKQRGGTAGVKSWAAANAEQAKYVNDILDGTEDTLRILTPRDPNAAGPDVKLGILKKLAVGAAKDSARLRDIVLEAGPDATVRQQLEYMGSIERARMIQAEFLGERAGVARALNALKDANEGSGEIAKMLDVIGYGEEAARTLFQEGRTPAEEAALLKVKLDEIMLRYKGKTVLDIAKLHKEIGTLKGSYKFAKETTRATTWEMIVEGWKSSLLSGPVTHTTNLFGTEAYHFLRPAVDALSAVIGMARGASPGMGESDRASMSEAVARLTGMVSGIQDGLKAGYHAFQIDQATGKTETYKEAIPGRAGELIRIPLRLMSAEDAIVSTMYMRGELKTLAIRQAFDEQMNPGTREFADRVTYLTDHPTPQMQAQAEAAGERMTFNSPLGEKGVALQRFVNTWNLQWAVPFIRTPINIAKELLRMSPFAPAVGEWRAAIARGGVERDRALAEMALGSGIAAITMAYAFSGNISGGGSPDPGKNRAKAGVWQPYSILVDDTWYEYARIQPVGTLMGMAADVATIWDHMTDEEKDKVPKMLAAAFAQAITNQTFLQGITNVVNAMSDPSRFGPRFLQQFAGSMVPNIIGQPTAMADPVVREVNSMLEAIQARIPGMRQQLLPKRDWLGQEIPTKERMGVVMPVREQPVSEDKVRLEAARLDLSVSVAPKKTHIGKGTGKLGDVELTPEERNAFQKAGGEMAHSILTNIVNAPGYDEMPDLIKRRIFGNVLTASHKFAAAMALPLEKKLAYIQQITERVQQELAPTE